VPKKSFLDMLKKPTAKAEEVLLLLTKVCIGCKKFICFVRSQSHLEASGMH
jgi:hypothetical protein